MSESGARVPEALPIQNRPMTQHIRKLVHTEVIPIRWGDMDAAGHVNNTVYFRYMEQARVGWYERMALNENGSAVPAGCGPVVISTACTFLRALRYPGDVEVKVFVSDLGRSSLTTHYEMRPSYDGGTIYAEGQAKGCWIDMNREKSIPLPHAVRELVEAA